MQIIMQLKILILSNKYTETWIGQYLGWHLLQLVIKYWSILLLLFDYMVSTMPSNDKLLGCWI